MAKAWALGLINEGSPAMARSFVQAMLGSEKDGRGEVPPALQAQARSRRCTSKRRQGRIGSGGCGYYL
jgi:hypothetical protein